MPVRQYVHRFQMLKVVRQAVLVAFLLAGHCTCGRAALVVLGDSYSDIGNGANVLVNDFLSTDQVSTGPFPAPPYFQGRFSNGPIWVDVASSKLGIGNSGLAVGAAVTGAPEETSAVPVYPPFANLSSAVSVPVPTTQQQALGYGYAHAGSINSGNTYVIFASANDYITTIAGSSNATVDGVIQAINNTMEILYSAGATQFIVFNCPPLQGLPLWLPPNTPANQTAAAQAAAANFASAHNKALPALINSFPSIYPGSSVQLYDVSAFFAKLISNAATEGFTSSEPCYQAPAFYPGLSEGYAHPICSNPDQHIFWDAVHLSKHANALLAADFVGSFPQLNAN